MVKGRTLVSSRSERFLGSHAYSNSPDTTGSDESELGEEDIWSTVDDVADRNHQIVNSSLGVWSSRTGGDSNGNIPMRSRRRIQLDEHHVGGLSLAFEDSSGDKTTSPRILHQFREHDGVSTTPRHMATSAPVNVPDWSKILRVDSVESLHDLDDGDNDGESEMVPPHEYLAREYRRKTGASVFEGVGRTLKGRDLRRVRDAVWSQTGFDG